MSVTGCGTSINTMCGILSQRKRLSTNSSSTISQYFLRAKEHYRERLDVDKLAKTKSAKLDQVYNNLHIHGSKISVLKDCEAVFIGEHEDFEELLNTKKILPFRNGVFDLDKSEFRPGVPEDCMSMSTNVDYIPYDPQNPVVQQIEDWFCKVQPDKEQRLYLQKYCGYLLTNDVQMQQIVVMSGVGSNGKSFFVECLLKPAMGQFYGTGATQLLTRKREEANQANESLMTLLKKRVAVFSEPAKRELLQVDILKQLSGGDEITTRGLHQKQQCVTPHFKTVIICNDIPKLTEDSFSIWRRIRIINWPVTFKDDPDPKNIYEQQLDRALKDKVKDWIPYLTGCMVHWLIKYRNEGLKEPESVIAHTKKYQDENDEYIDFRDKYIVKDANSAIAWSELRERFREWHDENFARRGAKRMTLRGDEIKKYFISKLGEERNSTIDKIKIRGFYGFKLQ